MSEKNLLIIRTFFVCYFLEQFFTWEIALKNEKKINLYFKALKLLQEHCYPAPSPYVLTFSQAISIQIVISYNF